MNCLVNILGRVDLENLLLDVPYVCKSWYKATCNPQCWTTLDFTKVSADGEMPENLGGKVSHWLIPERLTRTYRLSSSSSVTSFIKYVVKRGNGSITFVKLPSSWTKELLVYISMECPNLTTMKIPGKFDVFDIGNPMNSVHMLVSKWKRLESMTLSSHFNLCIILHQIGSYCRNFRTLEILDSFQISKGLVSALVIFVRDLKSLSLRCSYIDKDSLLKILKGCKKLEYLDARNCVGFEEKDDDILKCAAHIRTQKLQGSSLYWRD